MISRMALLLYRLRSEEVLNPLPYLELACQIVGTWFSYLTGKLYEVSLVARLYLQSLTIQRFSVGHVITSELVKL